MKPLITSLVIILLSCCSGLEMIKPPLTIASGEVRRIENFQSQYISPRNIDVWLPDGYGRNEQHSVLYMHDGQMLFDSTTTWNGQEWSVDEVMGRLIAENSIEKTIVVAVWNDGETRHVDYFPQKPFLSLPESYRDSLSNEAKELFPTEVRSDNYLKFIVHELKPLIDKKFATKTGKEHTFIAGSSMGGLISMYAVCEYPEVFGGAACLSTHWPGIFDVENNPIPGKFVEYLEENLPDPATHKIYFDYGTATLDTLYEPFQIQVDSVMIRKGFDEKNWITLKFEGKDHSERAWGERLESPLIFLLGK